MTSLSFLMSAEQISMAWATFLLVALAESGDKTQLTVAGLGSANLAPAVCIGATLALCLTSFIRRFVRRTLLREIPIAWTHKGNGILFIVMAFFSATQWYAAVRT